MAATVVLLRDGAGAIEVLLLQRPERGSFAGGWVFPGGRVEPSDSAPDDLDEEAAARRAAARETLEETGLVVEPDTLLPLSHWTPPDELPTKFLTWFFAGEAVDGRLRLQETEAVASEWIRPADALKRHGAGEMRLFPPTWVTLHSLLAHPTVESALTGIGDRGPRHYATRQDTSGEIARWAGDEGYDGAEDTEDGPRHRLVMRALPWRFEHR